MQILLTVIAGPNKGQEFIFDHHDTFLVGRSQHAHFRLPAADKYFSRIHFMMELNPPQCRLIDMGSRNGTYVNGVQVGAADLSDGDQIRAGHTVLRVQVRSVGAQPAARPRMEAESEPALPRIRGYHLERELGRGAMGVTYLGQLMGDPTMCTIKVVKPSLQGSPDQVQDFLRSARHLMRLDHPHIARLREVGPPDANGFYFVYEFVPGLDAAQILQRDGPVSVKRVVRWANQIMKALQYAHAMHFIHRDIKPTNVVVAQVEGKEVAKLTDFALARVYQTAPFSGLSLTAAMLNLASFIPPEVLFSFQEINPHADQYSLAATMYHLLTGADVLEIPREERKRYSSLLRRSYVPLRERRADVPVALADVIHKALSRTPALRFTDIAAFRDAMLRAVQE